MDFTPLQILYEDNHCLAIAKPSGLASAHFQGQEVTLDRVVKEYLKEKYQKPGKVFLGVVHRLDKPVSGVLLFARTSKAAARLSAQFRAGAIEKAYWALVENHFRLATRGGQRRERGVVHDLAGTLEDWLFKDEAAARIVTAPPETPGAQHALLHFEKRAEHGGLTLLELRPQTGRKHQLRVQLASR